MSRASYLAIAGLIGAATLALAPFEMLAPSSTGLPVPLLRLFAVVQPAILTLAAVAIGSALGPRVGLGAPLIDARRVGEPTAPVLRRQLRAAVPVAIATALVLVAYEVTVGQRLVAEASGDAERLASFEVPLITRVLYGGITEELLARWALVSLFAWAFWRLRGRPLKLAAGGFWIAIALAAMLFAVGHLPLTLAVAPAAPNWVVAVVLVGNALPGLAFGWLFWRRGIEAAMMAHGFAHLFAAFALLLVR